MNKTITVFEHSILRIGDHELNESDFEVLLKYNDLHGNRFFSSGYKKIMFRSYVGVIQVGNTVIEVLPKADKIFDDSEFIKNKWQNALLYMLEKAGYIKLNEAKRADQQFRKHNLLDIFLFSYLQEIENILNTGLLKKYRKVKGNEKVLRGRLLLNKQIVQNSIHKEFFYTEHVIYDKNHNLNGLLKRALQITYDTSNSSKIKQLACKQLLDFDQVGSYKGDTLLFSGIKYDVKTSPYKYAVELATMIVSGFNPSLSSGKKTAIGFFFDMNLVFEKFIYRMLKSQELFFQPYRLSFTRQASKLFWRNKSIRPDIIMDFEKILNGKSTSCRFIIDTKWKILNESQPSDNDLKQMYAYNLHFGANLSILIYPYVAQSSAGVYAFERSMSTLELEHFCHVSFIQMFKDGVIDIEFGQVFIEYLISL